MMSTRSPMDDAIRLTHEAMKTTFTLHLRGVDEALARSLERECFERIDLLENRLSRFAEGGDVYRINRLRKGETLYISEDCHKCLLLGIHAHALTGGLFDITLGNRIEHRKSSADGPPPPVTGRLTIHPDVPAVTCEEPGRIIDLGGIGKGYALDDLKRNLLEWDVGDALLSAGASSMLAFGPETWPVDLAGDGMELRIGLFNQSLSASGTGIQGSHIVHPAGSDAMPMKPCSRIWVTASTAALAEAWSTALMLLEPEDIADFIAGDDGPQAVYLDRDGRIFSVG